MASVGCLGALGVGSRYLKPGKTDHFGFFDCEIHLDKSFVKPFETIRGSIAIETTNEIRCYGLRVQFDATANLKFDTKVDNRLSTHKKIEGLLQECSEPGDGYYILSPVREQLSGFKENEEKYSTVLSPGSYKYSFSLKIPGENLPSAFRSQYGNLQYKIVAYMKSPYCYVQVAEKTLRFRGYNNLSQQPQLMEPIKHDSGFQKSMFSSKKVITATLTVEKGGFLPGEDLPFNLSIMNPKGFEVRRMIVNLVRRVTYNVNCNVKTTLVNLDAFEINEITKEEEITWTSKLSVPKNCIPSYNVKQVYSVVHLVQYQVKVAEYPGPMKGQVEVVIGTTKDLVEDLMSSMDRRMSNLQVDEQIPCRQRSDSIASRLSDSSIMSQMTTISVPPSYSQLSSRAMSMISLETLPPHYDDLD